MSSEIKANTISEVTPDNGVSIDGVKLKDNSVIVGDGGTIGSTSDTDAMAISSTGVITTPARPSFYAFGQSSNTVYTIAHNNYVILTNVSTIPAHNVGGHYSPTSGKFTTPVAGIYFFQFTWYATAGPTSSSTDPYEWVFTDGSTFYNRIGLTPQGVNQQNNLVFSGKIDASKEIGVQNVAGASRNIYIGTQVHTTFSGFLVG